MHSKIFYRIANKQGYGPYCLEQCPKTFEYLDNEGFVIRSDKRPMFKPDELIFKNADELFLFDWIYKDSEEMIYCFSGIDQMLSWFEERTFYFFEFFGEVYIHKFEMDYPNYFIDKTQCVVKKSEYLKVNKIIVPYNKFHFVVSNKLKKLNNSKKFDYEKI